MDIKSLTPNLPGKHPLDPPAVKAAMAPGDEAPRTQTPLSAHSLKALQGMLQMLQLGKVFDVIVTRVEGAMVTLQVPGSPADAPVLQAEMKSPPPIGTRLTLQLTEDDAKPELKVIATPNSPQDAVSRNLRQGLQQQRSLPPLLANLAMLAKSSGATPADLPDEIIEAVQQVVQQLPQMGQLKAPRLLRQALQQSGPYLEAALARQPLPDPAKPSSVPPLSMDTGPVSAQKQPGSPADPADVKIRLQGLNHTLNQMLQAMRQQPVQDVRANLLRLAVVLRSAAEQQSLQQALAASADRPAASTGTQAARPPAIPLPAGLTTPQPPTATHSAATPPGKPTTEVPQGAAAPPPGPAGLRSQVPQAQAQVPPSLAGILNRDGALGELLGQVEGALARIQVHQLQTAATDQQHRPVWIMELPVRTEHGIDLFDLRIQRDNENHAEGDPKAPWTVSLAFDLEKLGAIRAQITLYGEDRISTSFWAEQQETSTYFNQHLDKLERRFKQVGLDVAKVSCRCGKPPSPPASAEPRLVDEKV